MTNEEFAELVEQCRVEAERDPRGYRAGIVAWIVLGYGYLVLAGGLLALATVGLVFAALRAHVNLWLTGKLALPLGFLAYAAISSLWVTLPEPTGLELDEARAPKLAALIEEERRRAGVGRLHRILLTRDFNAGVSTVPRFGLFGGGRHFLMIGLPLLQALEVEQFRAVMAHEFGHLSGAHGRFGAFVYAMRRTWGQLIGQLEDGGMPGQGMFTGFLRWYAPRFSARTFVLAREQEYEADRASAVATSPAVAAGTLARIAVAGPLLGAKFWPSVFSAADEEADPPAAVHTRAGEALLSGATGDELQRWLAAAYAEPTGLADTHPGLADRLRALGFEQPPAPPAPFSHAQTAAALLGDAEAEVIEAIDREWASAVRHDWRVRHHDVTTLRQQLAADESRGEPLAPKARHERLVSILHVLGARAGADRAEVWIQEPDAPALPYFVAGVVRLQNGDGSGLELLEGAISRDAGALRGCAKAAIEYHMERGEEAEAKRWYERAIASPD